MIQWIPEAKMSHLKMFFLTMQICIKICAEKISQKHRRSRTIINNLCQ